MKNRWIWNPISSNIHYLGSKSLLLVDPAPLIVPNLVAREEAIPPELNLGAISEVKASAALKHHLITWGFLTSFDHQKYEDLTYLTV
jgi:hypothetical protein